MQSEQEFQVLKAIEIASNCVDGEGNLIHLPTHPILLENDADIMEIIDIYKNEIRKKLNREAEKLKKRR